MRRLALLVPCFVSVSCVSGYIGTGRDAAPELFAGPGWLKVDVQPQLQTQEEDCGCAALAMVFTHWKDPVTAMEMIEKLPPVPQKGIKTGDMRDFAKNRGYAAFVIEGTLVDLKDMLTKGRPPIVGMVKPHLQGYLAHYEVVVAMNVKEQLIGTMDPARGPRIYPWDGFVMEWAPSGAVLLLVARTEKPPPDTSK